MILYLEADIIFIAFVIFGFFEVFFAGVIVDKILVVFLLFDDGLGDSSAEMARIHY